jgi:hypothetical protein
MLPATLPTNLDSSQRPAHAVAVQQQQATIQAAPVAPVPPSPRVTGSGWQKVLLEDFEQPIYAPDESWLGIDDSTEDMGLYLWGQRNCNPHSGTASAWAGGLRQDGPDPDCGTTYHDNLATFLRYGPVDLSQVTDAQLVFGLWADLEGDRLNQIDTVSWLASMDNDTFAGWTLSGSTGDWVPRSLDLTDMGPLGDFTGQPEVYLRWDFRSDFSNPIDYQGAFIDDVALWVYTEPLSVTEPLPIEYPVTQHTTVQDFGGGSSDDGTVQITEQGDGALKLAPQLSELAAWDHLPSLPREMHSVEIQIAHDHLFVIGGNASNDFAQRQVYSTPLRDDGVIGQWQELEPLPQSLLAHASVVVGDDLFVLGGFNRTGTQQTVFRARIQPDGTLSPWATLTPLPQPLANMAAVTANGAIYVLGGEVPSSSGTVSDTVYRAQVNADGSIDAWETSPAPLPMPTRNQAAAVACNHLYMIAGVDESRERDGVFVSPIQDDGTLGTWELTHPLPNTLSGHEARAVNGGILVLGGWTSNTPDIDSQAAVYLLPIDETCAPGPWQTLTSMPYGSTYIGMAASNDVVYAPGGINFEGVTFDSVLMAPFQASSQPVAQGRYRNIFELGSDYMIQALQWTASEEGDTDIQVRYRVASTETGSFGPWSTPHSTNPISITAYGGYVEYEILLTQGTTMQTREISDISLIIAPNTPPQLADIPDQTLIAGQAPAPRIDLRTYASDAESDSEHLTFTLLDGIPPDAGVRIEDSFYLTVDPAATWIGEVTINVQVTDLGGLSDTDQVVLTVLPPDEQQTVFLPLVTR